MRGNNMGKFESVEEKVKFLILGKTNVKKPDTSFVIDLGQTVEGLVTEIKDSELYGKIYRLRVKSLDVPLIITGKTQLNDKLGYGKMEVKPVKVNDEVRITWTGTFKTKNGKGYTFDVAIARA